MSVLERSLLGFLFLVLAGEARAQLPSATPSAPQPAVAVAGLVADSLGTGIAGATVSVVGLSASAVTAADGTFRLHAVPAGEQRLVARRIGFRPESLTVSVPRDSGITVRVQLVTSAQQLAPMVVAAKAARYTGRMRGFNERRDRGMGKFFTADDIEQRRPRLVTDLLRTVSGTRISNVNGQSMVTFRGLRCPPLIWIDGAPATTGYLDVDLFMPASLAGIEVYPGISSVPSEFTWMRGKSNCGVIALWTKVPEPRTRPSVALSIRDLEAQLQSAQLYTAELVDTPAAPDENHPIVPAFPDSLLRAAVGGRVVAEFVVDVNGKPNMATFSAVQSTHPMFTEAVRGAIGAAQFTPAWLAGRRVRQLVQLPFRFAAPGKPEGS